MRPDDLIAGLFDRLRAVPELRALDLGEGRRFGLWNLASIAEGGLGEIIDPDSLTITQERRLRERLRQSGHDYRHKDAYSRRYWIIDASEIVGTIEVGTWPRGRDLVHLASLYVHPKARGRGLASAILESLYGTALAAGLLGITLDAHWTWQQAVRFYLNRGMWLKMWKHDLTFIQSAQLPEYQIVETADTTIFSVLQHNSPTPLLVAGRIGDRLTLTETPAFDLFSADSDACATLALHLALRGHPLVRSDAHWDNSGYSDTHHPEALAYKISVFERIARENGWRVHTPRIPGVPSRDP